MTHILIYKDREDFYKDRENIGQLQGRFPSSAFCDQNINSLKEQITKDKIQVLIILTQQRISKSLEDFLDKSRNHINLHDALIVIVHAKWSARDAQISLMLGASYLLEEPMDLNYLTAVVENHLSGREFDLNIGFQQFKSPLPCQVDSFGRIGRLEKQFPGNLYIETSLDWQVGANVEIHHLLAVDLKQEKLSYRVLDKNSRGLYYRYAYQYHLEWQKTPPLEAAYRNWLATHQKQISVPKVKLLYLLGDLRSGTPISFGTDLFSAYLASSGQLKYSFLERIDPQIIVKERLPELHEQTLNEWLAATQSKKLLLQEMNLLPTEKPEQDQLRDRLLKQIIPFTRGNFLASHEQFSYLSRKSSYSRLAVSGTAEIVALSNHHMLIHSPVNYAVGATLQVFLPGDSAPIFLRVFRSDKADQDGKWAVNCSIFYLADEQRHRILTEKVKHSAPGTKLNRSPSYVPIQKRVVFLDRQKNLILISLLAAVGIAIVLFFALKPATPSSRIETPANIAGESEEFESSLDAFQESVRKAFGASGQDKKTKDSK